MSRRWAAAARTAPTGRPASSSWIADLRHPRALRDGPRQAGQALRFLVEPAARLHGQLGMGPAAASSRTGWWPRTFCPTSTAIRSISGTCASARTYRPSTWAKTHQMALGDPPRARPGQGLRLLRGRRRYHQPAGRDLHLVAEGRRHLRGEKRPSPSTRAPRRPRTWAAASAGVRGGSSAGHRHRPQPRRQVFSTLPVGASARCINTMFPTR